MTEHTLTRRFDLCAQAGDRLIAVERIKEAMERLWPKALITQWYDPSEDAIAVTVRGDLLDAQS